MFYFLGYVSDTIGGFKNDLKNIWFKSYSRSRGAALDSSGFEHVFGGERRGSSVTGFHSWIMYYLEEKAGRMQYGGMKRTCQVGIGQVGLSFFKKNCRFD